MKHNGPSFCARALAASAALFAAHVARATVLVYEGFHEGDWTGITATGSQQIHKATTTGNYSTGFTAGSSWKMADTTTQIYVSGTNDGLSLPAVMTKKGFTTCGGAPHDAHPARVPPLRPRHHARAQGLSQAVAFGSTTLSCIVAPRRFW